MISGLNTGVRKIEIIDRDFDIQGDISVVKLVTKDDVSNAEAIKIFNKYKNKCIKNNSYNDDDWKIEENHKDSCVHLKFDIFPKHKNVLKNFFLIRLDTGMNPAACAKYSQLVHTFLKTTDYFNENLYDNFMENPYEIVYSPKNKSEILEMFNYRLRDLEDSSLWSNS